MTKAYEKLLNTGNQRNVSEHHNKVSPYTYQNQFSSVQSLSRV